MQKFAKLLHENGRSSGIMLIIVVWCHAWCNNHTTAWRACECDM